MKQLFYSTVLILFLVFTAYSECLELGCKVPSEWLRNRKKPKLFKTSKTEVTPFVDREIDNIIYTITFDKKSREIIGIYTVDFDFVRVNNLKVGLYLELTKDQISVHGDWE